MRPLILVLLMLLATNASHARQFMRTTFTIKVSYTHIKTNSQVIAKEAFELRYSTDKKYCIIFNNDFEVECLLQDKTVPGTSIAKIFILKEDISKLLSNMISGNNHHERVYELVGSSLNVDEYLEFNFVLPSGYTEQFHDDKHPDSVHIQFMFYGREKL